MPPMCRWATASLPGTGPAPQTSNLPTLAGIGGLASIGLQLPTGGPVPGAEPVWLRPGRYTYFVVRYVRHDRYPSLGRSTGRFYHPLGQTDITTWQAADGSSIGYSTEQRNLDDPHVIRAWGATPAVHTPPDQTDPRWIATEAWSTDPAVLAEQMAMWDPNDRRLTYLLQGIEDRYRHLLPTVAQHAAALAVLCTTPGLHLDGPTVDQAGRPGIAVSGEHHYGDRILDRATLILDPRTWRPQALTLTQIGGTAAWITNRSYLLLQAGYRIVT